MSLTMRYPFLYRIDDAPGLSPVHRTHLRRVANAICNRTGLHACFNARFGGQILFHHGDEFGGPLSLPAFHPDGTEKRHSDADIDDAVQWIKIGYIPRESKDRIQSRNEWLEKCHQRETVGKHFDDRRPEANSLVNWNDRKRRGVEKIISVS